MTRETKSIPIEEARRKYIEYDHNSKWLTALGFIAIMLIFGFGFVCGLFVGKVWL